MRKAPYRWHFLIISLSVSLFKEKGGKDIVIGVSLKVQISSSLAFFRTVNGLMEEILSAASYEQMLMFRQICSLAVSRNIAGIRYIVKERPNR